MKIEQMINNFRDLTHQISNVELNLSCDIEYLNIYNPDFKDTSLKESKIIKQKKLNESSINGAVNDDRSYKLLMFRKLNFKLKFTEIDSDGDSIDGDIICEIERYPHSPNQYRIIMKFNTNDLFENKIEPLLKKELLINILEILQKDLKKKISYSQTSVFDYLIVGLEEEDKLLNINPQDLKYWYADLSKAVERADNKTGEYYVQSYCHIADIKTDNKTSITFYLDFKEKQSSIKPSDLIDLIQYMLNDDVSNYKNVTFDGHYIHLS